MSTVNTLYGVPASSPEATKMEGFDILVSLALDMRWSWNHDADELWQQLAPALWDETHNPWLVVQSVGGDHVRWLLSSPAFKDKLDSIARLREEEDTRQSWFDMTYPNSILKKVAYFSMEFMLGESLPIYVGGLGNVAGDQLKSASDLGVPVIGIGLLYQKGYFRQYIDAYGNQIAYTPSNDPGQLPVMPLRLPNGEWLRIQISLQGKSVWLRAWQVKVGRTHLYLLDSNDAGNLPEHREITAEVYGGGMEMRIMQEIVLGIGGWRLLKTLGISPEVCHLNEGHAAFVVLERAYDHMQRTGCNFETALAITRSGNLFTTHTAVAAGFDHFDPSLIEKYLSVYAEKDLGITLNNLLALGRANPDNPYEGFNMAYLAVHGSSGINGVSKLHGAVSRHLFEPLFQRWPTEEVPIAHITNGVHMPTWEGDSADRLWTDAIATDRWKWPTEDFQHAIEKLPDEKIWEMRNGARAGLIDFIRKESASRLAAYGATQGAIDNAHKLFSPNVLTIGFARRFVAYKRPDLLLMDQDRLVRLLTNYEQPVQLVIAGKAPPADQSGRDLIKGWIQFIQRTGLTQHVIFLSDYDMLMAAHLVGGMDVWLNTPQRPWEASGTSGMKVLVNGGINLSELDGWWVEAYNPEVGWALGDGQEHPNDPGLNWREAQQLFDTLEHQVIPEFYNRRADGIPEAWVKRVRKSMATLTPYFSSNRTVREYAEKFYLTAATAYLNRAAYGDALGKKIIQWKNEVDQHWPNLKFGEFKADTRQDQHFFDVQVFLDGCGTDSIRVQLVAGSPLVTIEMQPGETHDGWTQYTATAPLTRPAGDYTARIIARNDEISIPLEYSRVLWQH
ncbi:MAG TPA: alpha-glucan family phosphorylase [Puia sp.]|nr:alpha-glucan family phosphorylase [Puia sp.]